MSARRRPRTKAYWQARAKYLTARIVYAKKSLTAQVVRALQRALCQAKHRLAVMSVREVEADLVRQVSR